MTKSIYPLTESVLEKIDLNAAIKVIKSKKITMGKKTQEIEKYFKNNVVRTDSLMVNSGSSANLLAFQCLINPYRKNRLKPGDEVLIPSVCWSTSLWPIIQSGLKPKFLFLFVSNFIFSLSEIIALFTSLTLQLNHSPPTFL